MHFFIFKIIPQKEVDIFKGKDKLYVTIVCEKRASYKLRSYHI